MHITGQEMLFEGTRGINLPVFRAGSRIGDGFHIQYALAHWIDDVMAVNVQPDEYRGPFEHHPYHTPTELILPEQPGYPFRFIRSLETNKVQGVAGGLVNVDSSKARPTNIHQRIVAAMPESSGEDYLHLFKLVETTAPSYHGVRATLHGDVLQDDFDTKKAVRKHNSVLYPAVRAILESLGYTDELARAAFPYKEYLKQTYHKYNPTLLVD